MTLDFFMLADGASVAEGKLYIHGGAITRVNPASLPSGPTLIAVVARLLIDEEDRGNPPVDVAIEWEKPDGTQLMPPLRAHVSADVPPDGIREGEDQGTIIVANALVVFDTAGPHSVLLRLNADVAVARRFFVAPAEEAS